MKLFGAIAAALLAGLLWGVAAGTYQTFPYDQLRALKNAVDGDAEASGAEAYRENEHSLAAAAGDEDWGTRADIVLVGDSITAYGRWNEMFPDTKMVNRAVGADTIEGVRQRLPTIMAVQPRKVFLSIGGTDALWANPHAEVIEKFGQVADAITESGAHLYIQSTFECRDNGVCTPETRERIRRINRDLADLSAADGDVTFIDVNAGLSDDGGLKAEYTWDGIHLNAYGYRAWRDVIARFVNEEVSRIGAQK